MTSPWTVSPRPPGTPEAAALLREYLIDVADRWYLRHHGRAATVEEMAGHLAEMVNDDLAPPRGVFLVGRHDDEPGGCVGLRLLDGDRAELTRMYIRSAKRGLGGAGLLLGAAERAAVGLGAQRLVLNTRLDLVEARALYARHGFQETARYAGDEDPYAECWYAKDLAGPLPS
ncbi:GNAT family N-acetyltransferase [Streptomyces sp. LX-29]|uniref:GNAT family N-acetyltransferase n=1 Tax=Streptomyces sp. LX-29 TaxID=2900152 RepID=UPI00240D310B|nr:GNAT family N-acetyltransferase [Streptomyces sp. LX-29]WFB09796.1 GNAT family N-acetyltransferase [Streptomyces sp. LX-29]